MKCEKNNLLVSLVSCDRLCPVLLLLKFWNIRHNAESPSSLVEVLHLVAGLACPRRPRRHGCRTGISKKDGSKLRWINFVLSDFCLQSICRLGLYRLSHPHARPARTQASKRNTPILTVKGYYPLSKKGASHPGARAPAGPT